jgi:hypothetical protein
MNSQIDLAKERIRKFSLSTDDVTISSFKELNDTLRSLSAKIDPKILRLAIEEAMRLFNDKAREACLDKDKLP